MMLRRVRLPGLSPFAATTGGILWVDDAFDRRVAHRFERSPISAKVWSGRHSMEDDMSEPMPGRGLVTVRIPAEIAFEAGKLSKVTTNLLNRLGCPGCHSGFDIRFIHEMDFAVNVRDLSVHTIPAPLER